MNRAMRRTKGGLYVPGASGFAYDPDYAGEGNVSATTTAPKRVLSPADKLSRAAAREELAHMIAICPPPGFTGDRQAYAESKATEVARRVEQRESGRRP